MSVDVNEFVGLFPVFVFGSGFGSVVWFCLITFLVFYIVSEVIEVRPYNDSL